MGQVVGVTNSNAEYLIERSYTPQDMLATIYRHFEIDYAAAFKDYFGFPVHNLSALVVALMSFAAIHALAEELAGQGIKMRAMTFNIRYANPGDGDNAWPHRRERVAEMIQSSDVDIAGLQEALFVQVEYLASRLLDYEWYGVGRDDGRQAGEFSPIFYRKDRFRPVDRSTYWLSTTPEKPGSKSWDAALPRIVTCLKLEERRTKQNFWAINTHFDHRGENARRESAKLIAERIASVAGSSPVVLMGDFNCRRNSDPYRLLTAAEHAEPAFQDTFKLSAEGHEGPDSTWNGFKEVVPGQVIDFIFVRGPIGVRRHATLVARFDGRFASDHLPVLTDLVIDVEKE